MKINELCGEAYNNAINNVIKQLKPFNFNWDYKHNWRDAHSFAEMHSVEFDYNGNFVIQ